MIFNVHDDAVMNEKRRVLWFWGREITMSLLAGMNRAKPLITRRTDEAQLSRYFINSSTVAPGEQGVQG